MAPIKITFNHTCFLKEHLQGQLNSGRQTSQSFLSQHNNVSSFSGAWTYTGPSYVRHFKNTIWINSCQLSAMDFYGG